jgi:predicted nucleic acid-binding Zn ribbon protein
MIGGRNLLLDFVCDECGNRREDVYVKSGRTANETCSCGSPMRRVFSAPSMRIDFVPGFDIGLGKTFYTKKERDDELERKGLRKVRD